MNLPHFFKEIKMFYKFKNTDINKIRDKSLRYSFYLIVITVIGIIVFSFADPIFSYAAEYTISNNVDSVYDTNTDLTVNGHITVKTDTLCGYALRFINNKNIPYVFGGGRWDGDGEANDTVNPETDEIIHNNWIFDEETLENLSTDTETGTDCTGFTGLVYKHFGIRITPGSAFLKDEAVKVIDNQDEALPGDIVWWENTHAGLYLGDGYVLHTNGAESNMYIHISHIGIQTYQPTAYLRMIDDESPLLDLNLYYDGEKVNLQDIIKELSEYDSTEQVSDDINAFLNNPADEFADENLNVAVKQVEAESKRPAFTGLPNIPINVKAIEIMENAEKINNNKLMMLKRR